MNKSKIISIAIIIILGICIILTLTINIYNEYTNENVNRVLTSEEQEMVNNQILQNMMQYAQ